MTADKFSIAMNGSMLDDHPTGVGIYSINVINNLSRLYSNDKIKKLTVFTPVRAALDNSVCTIKIPGLVKSSRYGKLAAFSRFIWNTFYYPYQVRDFDLLVSPTTHGSFISSNQVITIHDLISLRYKNISAHQRFYFKYFLPFLISRAKLIIAVSETTKKDIVTFLKCPEEKIKVVFNGYDHINYFTIEGNRHVIERAYGVKKYLLAIGPTYPHKNFETLIQAYKELDDSVRIQFPLVIAGGKKEYVNALKLLVKQLDLEINIRFIGYVPIDLMPALYREAEVFIFPSLYEGFGIPLLEAMACGCPVITSNTSSMPEVCGDAALYFDPLDRDSLKKRIMNLTEDRKLWNEMRKRGLEQVKKFSWQRTAQQLKSVIENIIH